MATSPTHRVSCTLPLTAEREDFFKKLGISKVSRRDGSTYLQGTKFGIRISIWDKLDSQSGQFLKMTCYTKHFLNRKGENCRETRIDISPCASGSGDEEENDGNIENVITKVIQDANKGKMCWQWRNKIRRTFLNV